MPPLLWPSAWRHSWGTGPRFAWESHINVVPAFGAAVARGIITQRVAIAGTGGPAAGLNRKFHSAHARHPVKNNLAGQPVKGVSLL